MLRVKYVFFPFVLLIINACSTTQLNEESQVYPDIPSYKESIESLAKKIVIKFQNIAIQNDNKISLKKIIRKKSFYIFNHDATSGKETELSKRYIFDLATALSNDLLIKRKKVVNWEKAVDSSNKVVCDEVLSKIASDYLIGLSIKDCPTNSHCLEANIDITKNGTNDTIFMANSTFRLEGNLFDWYYKQNRIAPVMGSIDNPYKNYVEAANYIVGKMKCIVDHKLKLNHKIRVIIAKTENTPVDVVATFSQKISEYGFNQVAAPDKWLSLAIKARDLFESGIFKTRDRELFQGANVLFALDMKQMHHNKYSIKNHLIAIETLRSSDKDNITIYAGDPLPDCAENAFVINTQNELPNKKFDTNNKINKQLNNSEKKIDPENKKRIYKKFKSVDDVLQQGQEIMISTIQTFLREQLIQDNVKPILANMITINGKLGNPNFFVENHNLLPKEISPRHYCNIKYELTIYIDEKKFFTNKGRVQGMGSNKDYAWRDALLKTVSASYPLTLKLSKTISQNEFTYEQLLEELILLDKNNWNMENTMNKINKLIEEIRQKIENISNNY